MTLHGKLKVYIASSWRNERQPEVVKAVRDAGFVVYDFRNPKEHALERDEGFHWSDIDPEWQTWTPEEFIGGLTHPLARDGFISDFEALQQADIIVLVMPCGRSSHLELGYAAGQGKPTIILLSDGEPELMYKMTTTLVVSMDELISALLLFG